MSTTRSEEISTGRASASDAESGKLAQERASGGIADPAEESAGGENRSARNSPEPGGMPAAVEAGQAMASASVAGDDLRGEIARLKDQLLRLAADFDNYKKRVRRQEDQTVRQWKENLLLRLLPVLDHFELGLKTARLNKLDGQMLAGFEHIYGQLVSFLRAEGVEPVEVRPGMPFDCSLHECLSQVPSDEHPPDTIVAETRRGYRLGEKILRAAQVVVSSGQQASSAAHGEVDVPQDGKNEASGGPPSERGPPLEVRGNEGRMVNGETQGNQ